ncbi:MAG: hypothetical protein R2879_21140 [Saprospiraceae bacterium]
MDNKKQIVEELGVLFERFKRTPMEGRVLAYLLVSDPPYQTFDNIREFLGASKSSVSTALNFFQREGTVDYKTFSGDRKRYFMINIYGWNKKLIETTKGLTTFNTLLEKVIDFRFRGKENSDEFSTKLKEVLKFQKYINEELLKAIERYNPD